MTMIGGIKKMLDPVKRGLKLMISRGVVRRSDDARKVRELQVAALAEETLGEVEHFQEYGFTSRPLPGCEVIGVCLGGHRSHMVAIASEDRRHRLRPLQPGEVAMYTDEGDRIVMKRGRVIEVVAGTQLAVTAPEVTVTAETSITLDTPEVSISGNLTAAGEVKDHTSTMQEMRDIYNGHTHTDSLGGTTTPPHQEQA